MLLSALLVACTPPTDPTATEPRRGTGDADAGWDYLLYGDYIGGGIPKDLYFQLVGETDVNALGRTGEAAGVPANFNLFTTENGVEVVGGITCLGCHGSYLQGEFVPGMGNAHNNYTTDNGLLVTLARLAVQNTYGVGSPEEQAFEPWARGGEAVAPAVRTPFAGPNPAFSVERAAVANRDPVTLEWLDTPRFDVPDLVMASDVPPFWNVKKKTRLYYTGMAGGDLATLISQVSMVGLSNRDQFDRISDNMVDVLAWLDQLESPPYPGSIDPTLASEGEEVFLATCSGCHGTYGDDWTYPQLIVPFDEIGTDRLYGEAFGGEFGAWLESSHMFADRQNAGVAYPSDGYVAPPLDGIWATAPYLHNGSVPDLHTLLNSPTRPAQWYRLGLLNVEGLGMNWTEPPDDLQDRTWVYDTTVPSYGNGGHTYGDALSQPDRTAVLEYLKTL